MNVTVPPEASVVLKAGWLDPGVAQHGQFGSTQFSFTSRLASEAVASAGPALATPSRATTAKSNSVRDLMVSSSCVQGHGSGDARCFPVCWGERNPYLQRQVMVAFERFPCLGVELHREGVLTGA